MDIIITIPEEFLNDWEADRFRDALKRLCVDAHCIAGRYEKETAEMLIQALANAREIPGSQTQTGYIPKNSQPTHD